MFSSATHESSSGLTHVGRAISRSVYYVDGIALAHGINSRLQMWYRCLQFFIVKINGTLSLKTIGKYHLLALFHLESKFVLLVSLHPLSDWLNLVTLFLRKKCAILSVFQMNRRLNWTPVSLVFLEIRLKRAKWKRKTFVHCLGNIFFQFFF